MTATETTTPRPLLPLVATARVVDTLTGAEVERFEGDAPAARYAAEGVTA